METLETFKQELISQLEFSLFLKDNIAKDPEIWDFAKCEVDYLVNAHSSLIIDIATDAFQLQKLTDRLIEEVSLLIRGIIKIANSQMELIYPFMSLCVKLSTISKVNFYLIVGWVINHMSAVEKYVNSVIMGNMDSTLTMISTNIESDYAVTLH
ncbi:hypothetical protein [Endozoicomonas sp. ONNA1]|uniref:hypothetical protein n=1 Tax=Endozoicomonas sp. ONNA1 TaxID=2828740 RepID=UPI002147CE61|nr:hypothetical protein [Endozoicomonas sp. ONNA1]